MEKTIFDKIVDWSTERNIIAAGKPSGQVLKVMEEMGEIAGGVAHNKLDLIKDAVGDVLVIMTNVAKMYGVEPSSVISFDYVELELSMIIAETREESPEDAEIWERIASEIKALYRDWETDRKSVV